MADEPEQFDPIELSLAWVGVNDTAIEFANQFAVTVDGDEIVLSVGQVSPPIIIGSTPAERFELASKLSVVPVNTAARFSLTPRRVIELRDLLSRTIEMQPWKESNGDD